MEPPKRMRAKKSDESKKNRKMEGVVLKEQRPLIAYLQVHTSDIDFNLIGTNETTVTDGLLDYTEILSLIDKESSNYHIQEKEKEKENENEKENDKRVILPVHYSEKLMVRFQDANRGHKIPESTECACFWDCNNFSGPPVVIPSVIEEGFWKVYGVFCSPECAAAYLFNEQLDLHVRWERFALLNRLYPQQNAQERIHLAPPKTVLRMFGGMLDISDYRELLQDKRMRVDVLTPPMISIIQVMDTKPIDFYDASMKNTFIPWEMDRTDRPGAQGLRLRRKKPIADEAATLDHCLTQT